MQNLVFSLCLLTSFFSLSQYFDAFSDGDFTQQPSWSGTFQKFEINDQFQLQSVDNSAGTAQLFRYINYTQSVEWQGTIQLDFSPSSSNFARIYLAGSDSIYSNQSLYLQFGSSGTTDALELVFNNNGLKTILLQGESGSISNPFQLKFKVTYLGGLITLYEQLNTATQFSEIGVSSFLIPESWRLGYGILAQYTLTNVKKFRFDDTYVGPIVEDKSPPQFLSCSLVEPNVLVFQFNESCSTEKVMVTPISPSNLNFTIEWDTLLFQAFRLHFSEELLENVQYTFHIKHLSDLHKNDTSFYVPFFKEKNESALLRDIIITEVMFDPAPSNGLALYDYIELYNRSSKKLNLKNWTLSDGSTTITLPEHWLEPQHYLVILGNAVKVDYPNCLQVSNFPNWNTEGDRCLLVNSTGVLIDELNYSADWYHDKSKSNGGFSIERISLQLLCTSALNWKATCAPSGGTPGQENCNLNDEFQLPKFKLNHVQFPTNYQLDLVFNQPILGNLDSLVFTVTPSLGEQMKQLNNDGTTLQLFQSESFELGKKYVIELSQLRTCDGTHYDLRDTFCIGFPPHKGQLLLNELLFNATKSAEYVELLNNSDVPINLFHLTIDKISASGTRYSSDDLPAITLYPHEYIYLTTDTTKVINQFKQCGNGIQLKLPEMSNDSGHLILTFYDQLIDELQYNESWHLPYYTDRTDKALERLSPSVIPKEDLNWTSGASTQHFGSPGRKNSHQLENTETTQSILQCKTPYFTPNSDGENDVLVIGLKAPIPNCVAELTVYDFQGNKVNELLINETIQQEETVFWTGKKENGELAEQGVYIVTLRLFHPEKKRFMIQKIGIESLWK